MTKPYRDQAEEICTADGVEVGGKKKIIDFSRLCEAFHAEPSTAEWLRCIRRVLDGEDGIQGWRVLRGDQLYLLSRVTRSSRRPGRASW
jgi:hypothetical protein